MRPRIVYADARPYLQFEIPGTHVVIAVPMTEGDLRLLGAECHNQADELELARRMGGRR